MHNQERLISIQEVSGRLRVPKYTLRFWEKELEGILSPLRTHGGQTVHRYQISVIQEIKKLGEKEGDESA